MARVYTGKPVPEALFKVTKPVLCIHGPPYAGGRVHRFALSSPPNPPHTGPCPCIQPWDCVDGGHRGGIGVTWRCRGRPLQACVKAVQPTPCTAPGGRERCTGHRRLTRGGPVLSANEPLAINRKRRPDAALRPFKKRVGKPLALFGFFPHSAGIRAWEHR